VDGRGRVLYEQYRSDKPESALDLQIARLPEADVRKHYATSLLDWAETDTYLREKARPVLGDFVDGDGYGVTTVESIIDGLVDRITALEKQVKEGVNK
jgi:hypothetical protein